MLQVTGFSAVDLPPIPKRFVLVLETGVKSRTRRRTRTTTNLESTVSDILEVSKQKPATYNL
jgi:hypothetical protein